MTLEMAFDVHLSGDRVPTRGVANMCRDPLYLFLFGTRSLVEWTGVGSAISIPPRLLTRAALEAVGYSMRGPFLLRPSLV